MTPLRHLAPVACVVAIAAAAGCGGGSPGPPSPTPTAGPSPTLQLVPTIVPTAGGAPPSSAVDLATGSGLLTVLAADEGDLPTGGMSAAGGDFNGDGVGDILLGAPFGDGPGNSRLEAGEAYVIYGPRALEGEIDLAGGGADVTIWGALAGDNLGFSVISGDLNGDGVDDVVVGAPGSNGLTNVRTDLGEAYVIFGSPSLAGTVDLAEVEQDFTFRPAEGFTRVGTTFAIGDVNADGVDDLIAGGPGGGRVEGSSVGSPRTTEGEVYVVFGGAGLVGEKDVARGEEDVRLKGAAELDGFGRSVASGDVNGDGVDDIVVGASSADGPDDARQEAGEAYVFFGSTALAGRVDSADAALTVLGAGEREALGAAVAGGDFNGDGLADIVLSAHFRGAPGGSRPNAGTAYVIFGSASLGGVLDLAGQATDAVVFGRDAFDFMPSAMAAADTDGDGLDDLALGAAAAAGPENSRPGAGEAYVLSGGALAGQIDLRVDVDAAVFVYGALSDEEAGRVASWSDIDGDGKPELLLLAPGRQDGSGGRGRLYLVGLPGP